MLTLLACLTAMAADVHLTHQGRLLDAAGEPISGTYDLDIALYSSEGASESLWEDSLSTSLVNGYFAVVLGSEVPLDSGLIATDELWISTSIDAVSSGARERVSESPRAAVALELLGTGITTTAGVRRWADGTSARSCKDYRYPAAGYAYRGDTGDGAYSLDPDGAGPHSARTMYCDMTTNGGGWTILYGTSGGDGELGLAAHATAGGDPLAFAYYNLTRGDKAVFSAQADESLFVRSDGPWLAASHPLYTIRIADPQNTWEQFDVLLTASNGATTSARMGWSNFNTSGGGDYGITTTAHGFDRHNTNYYLLNQSCDPMYLYSHSGASYDGDANYRVNTGLGSWSATEACVANESGSLAMYAAVR